MEYFTLVVIIGSMLVVGLFIEFVIKDIYKSVTKRIGKIENSNKTKKEEANLDKKLERLQKLGQLLKDGVITKEEFEEQKKKIEL